MALHYLRDIIEFRHDLVEGTRILEVQSNIGTGLLADLLGIDYELRPPQHTHGCQFLNTLVDGCAAHITETGDLQKWNTCIIRNQAEDLLVKSVYLTHYLLVLFL
jgi:hypothetical protein